MRRSRYSRWAWIRKASRLLALLLDLLLSLLQLLQELFGRLDGGLPFRLLLLFFPCLLLLRLVGLVGRIIGLRVVARVGLIRGLVLGILTLDNSGICP